MTLVVEGGGKLYKVTAGQIHMGYDEIFSNLDIWSGSLKVTRACLADPYIYTAAQVTECNVFEITIYYLVNFSFLFLATLF